MNRWNSRADYERHSAQEAIKLLSSEILRLIKLPYKSWGNLEKVRSLDKQIEYLEEVLAAFEKDNKRF